MLYDDATCNSFFSHIKSDNLVQITTHAGSAVILVKLQARMTRMSVIPTFVQVSGTLAVKAFVEVDKSAQSLQGAKGDFCEFFVKHSD